MEKENFFVYAKSKENQRVLISVAGIALISVIAGYIHEKGAMRYEDWLSFAENVPCDKLEKADRSVRVSGPLVVDHKSYEWHHAVTDQNLIEVIDERCHFKAD